MNVFLNKEINTSFVFLNKGKVTHTDTFVFLQSDNMITLHCTFLPFLAHTKSYIRKGTLFLLFYLFNHYFPAVSTVGKENSPLPLMMLLLPLISLVYFSLQALVGLLHDDVKQVFVQ